MGHHQLGPMGSVHTGRTPALFFSCSQTHCGREIKATKRRLNNSANQNHQRGAIVEQPGIGQTYTHLLVLNVMENLAYRRLKVGISGSVSPSPGL
jgi:hypothetical protein